VSAGCGSTPCGGHSGLDSRRVLVLLPPWTPSALMRQWVLDRLDAEKAPCGEATDAELLRGKLDTPAGCWTRSPRPKNACSPTHRHLTRPACSD
jgi:hypothetical protein